MSDRYTNCLASLMSWDDGTYHLDFLHEGEFAFTAVTCLKKLAHSSVEKYGYSRHRSLSFTNIGELPLGMFQ